jgi:hypothetical protein
MKTVNINGIEYPTYATVKEADDYFNAFFGSNWTCIDEVDKAKLLVSATRTIDAQEWRGVKKDDTQELSFPRLINKVETDERLLLKACCEEALAVNKSGTSSTVNTEGIQSVTVQDTTITFRTNAEEKAFKSNIAEDILRPYRFLGVSVLY